MSAARDTQRNDDFEEQRASSGRRTSGVRIRREVGEAAFEGRASSPDIVDAPVDNGVRGLRLVLGFWALLAVGGAAAWYFLLR